MSSLPQTLAPPEVLFLPGGVLYLVPRRQATDAERDLTSLLSSCPEPTSESDFAWEAECDEEEAWRVTAEWEAAERARQEDRLSQECPWLRFESDDLFLEV